MKKLIAVACSLVLAAGFLEAKDQPKTTETKIEVVNRPCQKQVLDYKMTIVVMPSEEWEAVKTEVDARGIYVFKEQKVMLAVTNSLLEIRSLPFYPAPGGASPLRKARQKKSCLKEPYPYPYQGQSL